ncbi:unnamed protein product [Staurois parvus]|uniref:Uncharacterized protein n=1 Tax=Staurois parvus TaxID=386267 RepID=A0ABN9F8H3_9NEOB|nr:unnamed protein product [Staurois parvus]
MIPYCPGGPMSCQSAPGAHQCRLSVPPISAAYQCPSVQSHQHTSMPLVPFIGFFGLGKDTGAP